MLITTQAQSESIWNNYEEAIEWYSKGYEWATKTFGASDRMSQTLKKCLNETQK